MIHLGSIPEHDNIFYGGFSNTGSIIKNISKWLKPYLKTFFNEPWTWVKLFSLFKMLPSTQTLGIAFDGWHHQGTEKLLHIDLIICSVELVKFYWWWKCMRQETEDTLEILMNLINDFKGKWILHFQNQSRLLEVIACWLHGRKSAFHVITLHNDIKELYHHATRSPDIVNKLFIAKIMAVVDLTHIQHGKKVKMAAAITSSLWTNLSYPFMTFLFQPFSIIPFPSWHS